MEDVRLLSLSDELHGCPFGVQIVHGIIPGLSRVSINLPAVHLSGGCPVRDLESLEESSGSSVEGNVSDSFEDGCGMEVLDVDVVHNVWLLVELLHIEVFDSDSYIIINLN